MRGLVWLLIALVFLVLVVVGVTTAILWSSHQIQLEGRSGRPHFVPGTNRVVVAGTAPGRTDLDLFAVDLDRMTYKALTATPECNESFPLVLPDARHIVFVSQAVGSQDSELFQLDMDTGKRTQLTFVGAATVAPALSPDGLSVIFVRAALRRPYSMGGMTWDKYDLWKLTLANGAEEQITHVGYRTISTPSVSTDGRVVYAARLTGLATSMLLLDLGDSPPTPAPFPLANSGASSDWSPTWAPNGRSVVFVSDRTAQFDYELWERTNASGAIRQLTFLRSYLGSPAFSPDGTTIVFLSDKGRNNKLELVSYDTRTGAIVSLTKLRPE